MVIMPLQLSDAFVGYRVTGYIAEDYVVSEIISKEN